MSKSLCLIFLACIIAMAAGFCDYKDSAGKPYNFLSLKNKDSIASDASYTFRFRFCDIVPETSCANGKGSNCAYTSQGDAFQYVYSRWSEVSGPVITGDEAEGLKLVFNNGDTAPWALTPLSTTINLSCGTANTPTAKVSEAGVTITMTHPAGCVARGGGGGGGGSSTPAKKKDDGLSGGAIFLIVLACVIPVYIILGCVYNIKVKKMPFGINACPQKAFWFALPGLIKDGAIFTYQKLRSLCNGKKATSEGGYDDGYGTMA